MLPKPLIILFAIILFAICPVSAFCARPLVIDNAAPVAQGHAQIEFGLSAAQPHKGGREQGWPVMALTYGLLKELQFGLNIQRVNSDPQGGAPTKGFEDLHLATKYNFLEENTYPAFAFSLDLKTPTANRHKGLSSGRVDENLLLIATKHYFPLAIDLNVGYLTVDSPPEEKLKNRLLGGVALRYGLNEEWRFVGEIFGQSREAKREKNEANFQIGVKYYFTPLIFSDAAVGRSLLPSGTRTRETFGITWIFPVNF